MLRYRYIYSTAVLILVIILFQFVASQITIETIPQDAVVCGANQNLTIRCSSTNPSQYVSYCISENEVDTECIDFSKKITEAEILNGVYQYVYSNVSKEDNNLHIKCCYSNNEAIMSNTVVLKVVYSVPQVTDININSDCENVTINWTPPNTTNSNDSYKFALIVAQVNYSNKDIANPPLSLRRDQFKDGESYNVSISAFVSVCENIVNFTKKEFEVQRGKGDECSDKASDTHASDDSASGDGGDKYLNSGDGGNNSNDTSDIDGGNSSNGSDSVDHGSASGNNSNQTINDGAKHKGNEKSLFQWIGIGVGVGFGFIIIIVVIPCILLVVILYTCIYIKTRNKLRNILFKINHPIKDIFELVDKPKKVEIKMTSSCSNSNNRKIFARQRSIDRSRST